MGGAYIILLACCASCYAASDLEIFQSLVLDRLNTLEGRVAEQNGLITSQQSVIEALLKTVFSKDEELKDIIHRPSRFVLESGDGPVAFTAAIQPRVQDHVGANATVKFETVITNLGGGYNNTTGVFTAPLPGLYMFSCSLLDHFDGKHGSAKLHAEIVQNDKILGRVFAHADDTNRDQGANTVFVQVNQGDRIFIRSVDNNDLALGGEMYSTFSGYLLMQL
ncbi:complement C1q-like protein 4 [Mercenaria mercenaria]|uniref:complement C1q-like protein 4 n=1 Tax=Mercenaria mercenaria TaxID=6596 RepID=UPI001E1DF607|nr:complement C1q-like protein 4 [Mercenaria mercenaria]